MSDARKVEIVGFEPVYAPYFRSLNVEWLEKYYRVEAVDEEILSHPRQKILEPGGDILFALVDGSVAGTVALKHDGDGVYELTKMAVTSDYQGLGLGRKLLEACVERYRQLEGSLLYLESQRRLKPALRLYESSGFRHAPRPRPSAYQRADVYMVYEPLRSSRAAVSAAGAEDDAGPPGGN